MSEKISQEEQMLVSAKEMGTFATIKTYIKLSGPGWLQSALTLGGGSLASALFLGVVAGTQFLWVQLFAMIMGVIMLSAISYVTLSTGKSPYKLILKEVNPVLAIGWLIASLLANMIWVMPQYSLAYSAITQNLAPNLFENPDASINKWIISLLILAFCSTLVMNYGKGGKGQKLFDHATKIVVAIIVFSFMAVSFKLVFIDKQVNFGRILSGFIPSFSDFSSPIDTYDKIISQLPDAASQAFWKSEIVGLQQTVLIAAAAFAVGVNMTFMMPFSILSRGWNKNFRNLAIFDLSTGMVIPFVIATSCVVIASAAAFHGKAVEGLLEKKGNQVVISQTAPAKAKKSVEKMLAKRQEKSTAPIASQELELAGMLVKRDLGSFTIALEAVVGKKMANVIFGLGVIAMGVSSITMMMLISGFCVCELGGFEHGGKAHKWGALLSSTGVLWHLVWAKSSAFLAVITGTIGFIFLPVAYIAFVLMFNSKRVMGEHMPQGNKRTIWNTLMFIAAGFTTWASFGNAWGKAYTTSAGTAVPVGKIFIITFVVLALLGQVYMKIKHSKEKAA